MDDAFGTKAVPGAMPCQRACPGRGAERSTPQPSLETDQRHSSTQYDSLVGPADEPLGTSWMERVTAVAGAITAVAGFVVIPGSIAMLVRLDRSNLPADLGVVVSLPSQFLLAVGFGYVVGPLLILIGLALAVTWLPGSRGTLTPALVSPRAAKRWHFVLLAAFLIAAGALLPFAVYGGSPPALAFVFSFLAGIVFLGGAWMIGRLQAGRGTSLGLVALLAAFTFVGWAILFAGVRAEFPATTLCLKDQEELDGVLIGRTAEDFYVGELENNAILLGVDDPLTQANILGGLQGANVGAKVIANPEEVTFQRANVVIADLSDGPELLRRPSDAEVPIVGYYPEFSDEKGIQEDFEGSDVDFAVDASEADVRRPATLKDLVDEALATTPENRLGVRPPRRIASVPESKVIGYRLGAAGPCPVKS